MGSEGIMEERNFEDPWHPPVEIKIQTVFLGK